MPEARPHATARGLVRIGRLVLADVLKDFAHRGCCYGGCCCWHQDLTLNGVWNLLNQAPGQEPFVHGCCPKFALQ
jgi:hypothetical protein